MRYDDQTTGMIRMVNSEAGKAITDQSNRRLYGWDEISNEIVEYADQATLDELNAEGGWEFNCRFAGVEFRRSDRNHVALSVWARDKREARQAFEAVSMVFHDCNR